MSNVTITFESAKANKTITTNPQHAFDLAGLWLEEYQPAFCTCTLDAFGQSIEINLRECEEDGAYIADQTTDALAAAYKTAAQR